MLRNGGVEDNPAYELVVHPPLGKQLIALGEWLLGYNGWGWRAAAALAGTLTVLLVIRIARRLTRSTLLGGIAGVLLICDGLSHVQSRMGMLDAFAAFFVVAAFATLLRDRDDVRARHGRRARRGPGRRLPLRPAAGRALVAVRHRRAARARLRGQVVGPLLARRLRAAHPGLRRDGAAGRRRAPPVGRHAGARPRRRPSWALALLPVLVYLGSWWAWFRSETGIDRNVVGLARGANGIGPDGPWAFVPDALRSLWFYSGHVLDFHAGLTTQSSGQHPWESKPWTWPMGLRPMLYYYASGRQGHRLRDRRLHQRGDADRHARRCGGRRSPCWRGACGARSPGSTGATGPCSSATARACCRGSPTSTGRCTSSTWRRSRRSSCWRSCW